MREKIARAIRENVLVDATGMSPAIASAYIIGFNEAADAVLDALMEPTKPMIFFGMDAMCRDNLEPTEAEFKAGFVWAIKAAKDGK